MGKFNLCILKCGLVDIVDENGSFYKNEEE